MNKILSSTFGVHEDKLVAPFFLTKQELSDSGAVKNKLILYLKEDVLKYKGNLFTKNTFSEIAQELDDNKNVFTEILDLVSLYEDI